MSEKIDYLGIGHVCYDVTATGKQIGGTVAYSGRAAKVLGCRTAVLTSAAHRYEMDRALPGIPVERVPAPKSTTFENVYTADGEREQIIHSVAETLRPAHVPAAWRRASVVHLGPIANEIDADIIHLFSNSLVGLTPQGWLRQWEEDGRVHARPWPEAEKILPLAAAAILSEEDLLDDAMLGRFREWSPLLVLTRGRAGCTIFFGGDARDVPAPSVRGVEYTGAGDIFAAAFFIRLYQTDGNPWEAARYANAIAAQSVTQTNIEAKMALLKKWQTAA